MKGALTMRTMFGMTTTSISYYDKQKKSIETISIAP